MISFNYKDMSSIDEHIVVPASAETDTPAADRQELPVAGLGNEVDQVTRATKQRFYVERLLAQTPKEERVSKASVIREEKEFSKMEIVEAMVQFAMDCKLELGEAEVSKIITNEEGKILVMEFKVPGDNGSYQLIGFTIKGRHGDGNEAGKTGIDRTSWDADDMPDPETSYADYIDGKWLFVA